LFHTSGATNTAISRERRRPDGTRRGSGAEADDEGERLDGLVRDPGPLRCQFALTDAICQAKLTDMNDTDQGSVDLSAVLATGDPVVGLRAVLALRRLAERVEAQQVALAREQGWSWQQIGDALGVTRQSIHAKYGKRPW
jgi:hypothetical protein